MPKLRADYCEECNLRLNILKYGLTCGILNNLKRFATWIEVTEEAAPTTPAITRCFLPPGYSPSEQVAAMSTSSILLIEPENKYKNPILQLL